MGEGLSSIGTFVSSEWNGMLGVDIPLRRQGTSGSFRTYRIDEAMQPPGVLISASLVDLLRNQACDVLYAGLETTTSFDE